MDKYEVSGIGFKDDKYISTPERKKAGRISDRLDVFLPGLFLSKRKEVINRYNQ